MKMISAGSLLVMRHIIPSPTKGTRAVLQQHLLLILREGYTSNDDLPDNKNNSMPRSTNDEDNEQGGNDNGCQWRGVFEGVVQ
jgi:hypothetical protein